MRRRAEWRAALAVMASVAGVGFASGREIALFFAQLKGAAWAGIAAASALFALMTGIASGRARMGCGDGASHALRGDVLAGIHETLRLLLAALTSAAMLSRAGDMGALTLPMRHGYAFGAAFALLIALAVGWRRGRRLPAVGALAVLAACLFYGGMALDARPVRLYARSETVLSLAGSLPAAALLALVYASLNASVAAWSMDGLRDSAVRPARLGALSGALLGLALTLGNLALRRGGDALLAQMEPWVLLSARWGVAGFWLCAGFQYLCSVSTLSVSLGLLVRRALSDRRGRTMAVFMLTAAAVVFAILSFGRI